MKNNSNKKFFCFIYLLEILFLVTSSILLTGCEDNNNKTLGEMLTHLKKQGLNIKSIQPLNPDPVKASMGIAINIDGRQVGIYKYNLKKKKAQKKIKIIYENECVYILGRKFPALVNGAFVLIDYKEHPNTEAIVEAFEDF